MFTVALHHLDITLSFPSWIVLLMFLISNKIPIMSDKGGNEKEGAAKPAVPTNDTSAPSTFDPAPQDPRHAAWIAQSGTSMPLKYDYKVLNMTEAEHRAAQGDTPAETPGDVLQDAGWAMNAKVYEWSEDYGDVGPAHPVLEKQLFGSDVHVLAGVDFSR